MRTKLPGSEFGFHVNRCTYGCALCSPVRCEANLQGGGGRCRHRLIRGLKSCGISGHRVQVALAPAATTKEPT